MSKRDCADSLYLQKKAALNLIKPVFTFIFILLIPLVSGAAGSIKVYALKNGLSLRAEGIQDSLYRRDASPPQSTVRFYIELPGPELADARRQFQEFVSRNKTLSAGHDLNPTVMPNAHTMQVDITSLLPEVMQRYLGVNGRDLTSGDVGETENCLGLVRAFILNESQVNFTDSKGLLPVLARTFSKVNSRANELEFGDAFYLPAEDHAAVYLFDGLIFQKPSFFPYHAYEIVTFEKMFETRNKTVARLRDHPLPESDFFHVSSSSYFTSNMKSAMLNTAPDLEKRPAAIEVWRQKNCHGPLTAEGAGSSR